MTIIAQEVSINVFSLEIDQPAAANRAVPRVLYITKIITGTNVEYILA
jgi:hypothetical protein